MMMELMALMMMIIIIIIMISIMMIIMMIIMIIEWANALVPPTPISGLSGGERAKRPGILL